MYRLKKAQTPCREALGTDQRQTTELLSSFSQKCPWFDNGVGEQLDWTLQSPSALVVHEVAPCWRCAGTQEPEGSLTSTHPTPATWGWLAGAPELLRTCKGWSTEDTQPWPSCSGPSSLSQDAPAHPRETNLKPLHNSEGKPVNKSTWG